MFRVVGEMFHQLRMYTCISYMLGNILFLLGDTSLCMDRHNNMALSMTLMFFYQAALWWNMCEAHATFKGITSGLINGRTSVYHPIAWGGPLICLGALCFFYGELLGTHPNCFVSWENGPVAIFFFYNLFTFLMTIGFEVIILFNVVRVQSHNKETVMYLKDQVKGLVVTSFLMIILWGVPSIGYFSYFKDETLDMTNPAPLFHILNGWFGVIMFLTLGMWSKRFRIGLRSQAEEKKKMMLMKQGENYAEDQEALQKTDEDTISHSTASPVSSRPSSGVITNNEEDSPVAEAEDPPPEEAPSADDAGGDEAIPDEHLDADEAPPDEEPEDIEPSGEDAV